MLLNAFTIFDYGCSSFDISINAIDLKNQHIARRTADKQQVLQTIQTRQAENAQFDLHLIAQLFDWVGEQTFAQIFAVNLFEQRRIRDFDWSEKVQERFNYVRAVRVWKERQTSRFHETWGKPPR